MRGLGAWAALWWLATASAGAGACSPDLSSAVALAVGSRRNSSGHWITQVGVQQSAAVESRATLVQLQHSTASCEGLKNTLDMVLTFTAPPPRVGPDYELFPSLGYYKFHNVLATWQEAGRACAAEHAHLAVIGSDLEEKVMATLFTRVDAVVGTTKHLAWVGVQRIGEDHYTIHGEGLTKATGGRWCSGEPNRAGEFCVTVNRNSGCLVDINCLHKAAFICEQPL